MIIYFIVFGLSVILMRKAYCNKIDYNDHYKRYLVFSLLLIAFFAAFRGVNIGTDTRGYQSRLFYIAENFSSLPAFLAASDQEPVYSFMTFIASRTHQLWICHLLNILVILVPLYIVIWEEREDVSPQLSLASFLAFYYGWSINGVRQAMAMSISMLAIMLFSKKKYFLSLILLLLSVGFHYSAVIGFVIVVLYYMAISNLKSIYNYIIIAGSVLSIIFFRQIINIALRVFSFFKSNYGSTRALGTGDFETNITMIILVVMGIVILYLTRGLETFGFINYDFKRVILIILTVSIFIGGNLGYANRVFKYFDRYLIFIIPNYERIIDRGDGNRILFKVGFYAFLIGYWLFAYVYKGWSEIVPYYPFWVE